MASAEPNPQRSPERRTRRRRRGSAARALEFVNLRLDSARRVFDSDAQVARALGVDPAQVARWRRGQVPDEENSDRLAGLDAVIEMLDGYLNPGRIPKWLSGPNVNLGGRTPLVALRAGDLPAVIAAVRVLKSGAHG
ncbi:MAG: hypothetical protein HY703_12365 [Gemmatimonadetes bacterium]|nr:hypothetical protein [Gemmatimonadota bacterium]